MPNWIAPHVLLPAHSGVELIGVWDMERRLVGDMDEWARHMRGQGFASTSHGSGDGDSYFMLLEQFGSLLGLEAFPSLLAVRHMSWESDVIRRTGRLRLGHASQLAPSSLSSSRDKSSLSSEYPYTTHILGLNSATTTAAAS